MTYDTAEATAERPRILLVEDDAAVRRSLQLVLHSRGFDVRAYSAGSDLLADPNAQEAKAFVADYRLNDSDGIEVLKALRTNGWQGPAILITGYPSADVAQRANAAGFSQVIEKPLREQLLGDILYRLLDAPPTSSGESNQFRS